MKFRDGQCLNNTTSTERENILALAIYYKLGKFDPSDKHIQTYKNKDIVNLYKKITEVKLTTTNTLLRIYKCIYQINIRIRNKTKISNKSKTKLTKTI